MFIGVYNLANFVTLLGLASSVLACFVASAGDYESLRWAVVLFLLSGLCDMCDGRIARGAGSRTRKEKVFGIQIDTVCDMVSFGVTPVVIAFFCGFNEWYHILGYIVYAACAAIRLAYFNTQAIEETPDLNMKAFTGVPVPFSCLVLPPLVLLLKFVDNPRNLAVALVYAFAYLAVGIAFIVNVKIMKLKIWECVLVVIFELACISLLFINL